MEHFVGICIERGKQAKDEFFWQLDYEFSNMCIDIFVQLLEDLKIVELNYDDILFVLDKYMGILYAELVNIRNMINMHGISECKLRLQVGKMRAMYG